MVGYTLDDVKASLVIMYGLAKMTRQELQRVAVHKTLKMMAMHTTHMPS